MSYKYDIINITSKNGSVFRFCIQEPDSSDYFSLNIDPESRFRTAQEAFIKAINIITNDCKADDIAYIHNPCGTWFISEYKQNKILSDLGINIKVTCSSYNYDVVAVTSINGTVFEVGIEKLDLLEYFILRINGEQPDQSKYKTAEEAFREAIKILINNYCTVDIADIHNPCGSNIAFLSIDKQNKILLDLGIDIKVRVN